MKDNKQANKGMPFEEILEIVHSRYQRLGIACLHKVPTKFLPIRDRNGHIVSCKVEEKSCVDYLGRYRSIAVAVEAKNEDDNRISFSRVEPHQAKFFDDYIRNSNAVGIVVVSFGLKRFFAVPWVFWKSARDAWINRLDKSKRHCESIKVNAYGWEWETPGMASASPEQFLPVWEITRDVVMGIPYLSIIDKMTTTLSGGQEHGQSD